MIGCESYYPQVNWNTGGFKINVVGGVNAMPREFPFMVSGFTRNPQLLQITIRWLYVGVN